jgi:hypothetical protein
MMKMKKFIKELFVKKIEEEKPLIITCGERNKNGVCDTYINGEKSNVRMLVFTEKEIERIGYQNENQLDC